MDREVVSPVEEAVRVEWRWPDGEGFAPGGGGMGRTDSIEFPHVAFFPEPVRELVEDGYEAELQARVDRALRRIAVGLDLDPDWLVRPYVGRHVSPNISRRWWVEGGKHEG